MFIFLFIMVAITVNAQPAFELEASLQIDHQSFTTDMLGNVYVVKGKEIQKYNDKFKISGSYSKPGSGFPASIDATDPFRILVFYRELNQIIWLDNTLSPILSPVDLIQMDINTPLAVCSSSKGGFWILSGTSRKLSYFDKNLGLKIENQVASVFFSNINKPVIMLEKNEQLFVGCNQEVWVFDLFANFIKKILLPYSLSFQASGDQVWAFSNSMIVFVSQADSFTMVVPQAKDAIDARIEKNKLFLSKKGMIEKYKIIPE